MENERHAGALQDCGPLEPAIPWVAQSPEVFVERVHDLCAIVDRDSARVLGVRLRFGPESRETDWDAARRYIANGTCDLLAELAGVQRAEYVSVRTAIRGGDLFDLVVGIFVPPDAPLPAILPQDGAWLDCPAGRFARLEINQGGDPNRIGYRERMTADEYFISDFRADTSYIYDAAAMPFNTYDRNGDMLAKYEPVKHTVTPGKGLTNLTFQVVYLPQISCACCSRPADDGFNAIMDFFQAEARLRALPGYPLYPNTYFGLPVNEHGATDSCFGVQVHSFQGIPDTFRRVIIPPGPYLHIAQLEFNGDNPSMPYDAAFNHLEELFLKDHPQYRRDDSRHVVARFRLGNCASVYVPLAQRPTCGQ